MSGSVRSIEKMLEEVLGKDGYKVSNNYSGEQVVAAQPPDAVHDDNHFQLHREPMQQENPKFNSTVAQDGADVWAVVSDMHCGSTLGLIHPDGVQLDDGGWYYPSKAQLKLWLAWTEFWSVVEDRSRGKDLYVVINGDLTDGDHHGTAQIVSKSMAATQHEISIKALEPILSLNPKGVVVVRGTEVHVGKSAEYEEAIATKLADIGVPIIPCLETGTNSWWHFQAVSNNVLLDFAHHGRMGTRPWTKLTGPGTLAAQIVLAAASEGVRHPNVAFRSHKHTWGDTYDNFETRVVALGGWQLATAFVHRIAAGSVPHLGGAIATTLDGHVAIEKIKFKFKRPKPWRTRPEK